MDKKPPGPPKPTKVVRKLRLAKEIVAVSFDETTAVSCTKRATGCPVHTC